MVKILRLIITLYGRCLSYLTLGSRSGHLNNALRSWRNYVRFLS